MTNKAILEQAIQKAIDGGWLPCAPKYHFEGNAIYWDGDTTTLRESLRSLIYDHDFAKALWGEAIPLNSQELKEQGFSGGLGQVTTMGWQYHLQSMVIAEDPIKYLGENI